MELIANEAAIDCSDQYKLQELHSGAHKMQYWLLKTHLETDVVSYPVREQCILYQAIQYQPERG